VRPTPRFRHLPGALPAAAAQDFGVLAHSRTVFVIQRRTIQNLDRNRRPVAEAILCAVSALHRPKREVFCKKKGKHMTAEKINAPANSPAAGLPRPSRLEWPIESEDVESVIVVYQNS